MGRPSRLLKDGVDIRVIQALLGHAKLGNMAFHTRVASRTVTSPLDKITMLSGETPGA